MVNTLVYGSEAWVPKASQMRRLDVFHMRCLRRILGVSPLDHVTNRAVLLKAKTDSIDVIARRYRLRWLGHVGRMRSAAPLPDGRWVSDRVPLRLLSAWLDGPRPVGRPPKPWVQSVAGDIAHYQLPEGARWQDWLCAKHGRYGRRLSIPCVVPSPTWDSYGDVATRNGVLID